MTFALQLAATALLTVAMFLGWGWGGAGPVDPSDFWGWHTTGLVCFVASFLPFHRYNRH